MKKIRRTAVNIAFFIVFVSALSSAFITMIFIMTYIAIHYPEFWASLNSTWVTDKDRLVGFGTGLAITLAALGVASATFFLFKSAADHLLQCNIIHQTDKYPTGYYISNYSLIKDDQNAPVQLSTKYRKAYTVLLKLSFEEMEKILRYMELYKEQYYEMPKSFLMPDSVSWLHPYISLHTTRCIMKKLQNNGVVILMYKVAFPRDSQIKRTSARVRIKANLYTPTGINVSIID